MKFESVVPVLYSSDVNRSVAYYTEKPGFSSSGVWDSGNYFGGVGLDQTAIFVSKKEGGNAAPGFV